MRPSMSEVDTRKEWQRTFVLVVKMHNEVRRVQERTAHGCKSTLIWYVLQELLD